MDNNMSGDEDRRHSRALRLRLLVVVAAGLVATPLFVLYRGLPWSLASVLGVAIGALAWSVSRTGERLRRAYRSPFVLRRDEQDEQRSEEQDVNQGHR